MDKKHAKISELKAQALEGLKGNWITAVLTTFIYGLLVWLPNGLRSTFDLKTKADSIDSFSVDMFKSMVANQPEQSALAATMPFIIFVINLLIAGALTYGITKFFIALKRGQEARIENLFDGFKKYGPTFLMNLLMTIFGFLWSLLWIIPTGIIGIILIGAIGSAITKSVSGTVIGGLIIAGIVFIAVIVSLTIFLYRYAMTYYIYLDNDDISALEALDRSINLMKGNKIRFFLLELSFIGWYLLATVPFIISLIALISTEGSAITIITTVITVILIFVAMLWISPYMKATNACFYDDLIKDDRKDEFEF